MRNSYKCEINCKKARGIFLKDTFSFQLERRLEKELNLSATAPSESYSSAGWAEMEIFTLRIYYLNISRSFVRGNINGRKRIY